MSGASITISLNGVDRTVAAGTSVEALVAAELPSGRGIAVARNDEVVPRSTWAVVLVASGDRIELLTAAQGG